MSTPHPGPRPPAFHYDPATARALIAAADGLAAAVESVRSGARSGREVLEDAPFTGTTADVVRDRHDDLDADAARLLTDLADQITGLEAEITEGTERRAAATDAYRRWRRELLAWEADQ